MDFLKSIKNNENITIDFVGDSITYGLNHCRPEETYVAKFAAFLGEKYKSHTVLRYDGIGKGEFENLQSFDGPILVSLGEGEGKIDVDTNEINLICIHCPYYTLDRNFFKGSDKK